MPEKTPSVGLCVFDFVAIAVGLLVATGWALRPGGDYSSGTTFVLPAIWIGFVMFRRHAYRQPVPWIVVAFAAFFALALVVTFWPAPLMWFAAAVSAGSFLLLVGVVAPKKRLFEPFTRIEMFKLVTVLTTVVLMIALAETFLRTFATSFSDETQQALAATPANSGVAHPYIGYLHRPSRDMVQAGRDFKATHHVDAAGFRNSGPRPERAEIVAVGDSLTFGLNVGDDHAWPLIVGRTLHTDVINLGLVGASPEQYRRVYETFGADFQPKLLLVGLYPQNDFWDAGMFDLWLREGIGDNYMVWRNFGRPLRVPFTLRQPFAAAEGAFRGHIYPIIRSSYLYNLMRAIRGGGAGGTPVTMSFGDGSRLQLDRQGFESMTSGSEAGQREFRLVLDSLRALHAFTAERGTRMLVILQPSKEEVYLPLRGDTVRDPAAALRKAMEDAGIAYLDLAPVFHERAAAGERLFFEIDSHPNEAGYGLIGWSVASYLTQHADAYGLAR